jgi:chromosome segregation ATPase
MTTMADPRQALRQKLAEVLGERHAETLMRALPTPDGVDLATRSDSDALGTRIDGIDSRLGALEARMGALEGRMGALEGRMGALEGRMDALEARMDALEARMERVEVRLDMVFEALRAQSESFGSELRAQTRTFMLSQMGAMATIGAVFTAALAIT